MHVSVVVTQFLRELFFALNLSLFVQSLRFPSQPHFGTPWCAVLGLHPLCPSVFRPIECFLYEGLHLLVWLCPCFVSSLFGKGAMFLPLIQYSGRHEESYIQRISTFHQAALDMCVWSLTIWCLVVHTRPQRILILGGKWSPGRTTNDRHIGK